MCRVAGQPTKDRAKSSDFRAVIRFIVALVAACAALSAVAPAAPAITNGEDDAGRHPYVGALISHDGKGRKKHLICTGTLIGSSLFVTAAHCLLDEPSDLYVSFDRFVGAPDVGPEVTLYHGQAIAHPNFVSETTPGDSHDVAVVTLDRRVPGITPAKLASTGTLDSLAKNPARTRWGLAGYGREGFDGRFFFGGGSRRFAWGAFDSLEPFKLHTDQTGTIGGTCNGDSGGPVLQNGEAKVLAVVSDGDAECAATGINYRLDTASARNFLDSFRR